MLLKAQITVTESQEENVFYSVLYEVISKLHPLNSVLFQSLEGPFPLILAF